MKLKLLFVLFGLMSMQNVFAVCESERNAYLDEYITKAHDPEMRQIRDKETQKELQAIASNDREGMEQIVHGSYGWQAKNGEQYSSYTIFSKCMVITAQKNLNNSKGIKQSNDIDIQASSIEQRRLNAQSSSSGTSKLNRIDRNSSTNKNNQYVQGLNSCTLISEVDDKKRVHLVNQCGKTLSVFWYDQGNCRTGCADYPIKSQKTFFGVTAPVYYAVCPYPKGAVDDQGKPWHGGKFKCF